jgi:hypothetical protein
MKNFNINKIFTTFKTTRLLSILSTGGSLERMDFQSMRIRMIRDQLMTRDITSENVLRAMNEVPRHCFIPQSLSRMSYDDNPLPIG